MKTKKLKLNEISVNSFITNINDESLKFTINGGVAEESRTTILPTQNIPNSQCATKCGCPDFTAKEALLCGWTRDFIKWLTENTPAHNDCSAVRRGSCGGTIGA